MIRVGIQRILRRESVVPTLVGRPKQSIALKVEGGLKSLCLVEGFREKEDDRMVFGVVRVSVVGVLIGDGYRRELIKFRPFPILTSVRR
jgi:hypothetical protein